MFELILLVSALAALAVMTYVAYRFYRKAAVYDTILTYINDDIIANLRHFEKMSKMNVFSNEPTVQEAHQLMIHMGKRLNEISLQMEEVTGLKLRPKRIGPRPVVE